MAVDLLYVHADDSELFVIWPQTGVRWHFPPLVFVNIDKITDKEMARHLVADAELRLDACQHLQYICALYISRAHKNGQLE